MEDKLDRIFNLQKKFGEKYTNFKSENTKLEYKEERTRNFVLALIEEAVELLRTINHKEWKTQKFIPDTSKLKEEIIDITHFLISIALIWGMDAEKFFKKYLEKNKINWERRLKNY